MQGLARSLLDKGFGSFPFLFGVSLGCKEWCRMTERTDTKKEATSPSPDNLSWVDNLAGTSPVPSLTAAHRFDDLFQKTRQPDIQRFRGRGFMVTLRYHGPLTRHT